MHSGHGEGVEAIIIQTIRTSTHMSKGEAKSKAIQEERNQEELEATFWKMLLVRAHGDRVDWQHGTVPQMTPRHTDWQAPSSPQCSGHLIWGFSGQPEHGTASRHGATLPSSGCPVEILRAELVWKGQELGTRRGPPGTSRAQALPLTIPFTNVPELRFHFLMVNIRAKLSVPHPPVTLARLKIYTENDLKIIHLESMLVHAYTRVQPTRTSEHHAAGWYFEVSS